MEESVSVAVWHWYSIEQALAAANLSRKSAELESRFSPVPEENEVPAADHRAFVVSSILASSAFLEASINELFASAQHANLQMGGVLPASARKALVEAAEYLTGNRLLDRFQLALTLVGQAAFDKGAAPYQDVALVVQMRNELVHYKPRWRKAGDDADQVAEEARFVRALAAKKFRPNPFTGAGNPFFPDKCLSHAVAAWAWTSALGFADDFYGRLGVPPVYEHVRDQLRAS